MMKNERITEDFVRDHFKNDPLYEAIRFEEQKTKITKAKNCLSKASKKLSGRPGYPEFIISFPPFPDDIIVIECKAEQKFHESKTRDVPDGYAVDGVLHYSRFLAPEYNVIAIAVSGDNKDKLKISTFYQKKGSKKVAEEDKDLISIYSYIKKLQDEIQANNIENAEITKTAIELNNDLNDYSIVEYERCTLVSSILFALQDEGFKKSYKNDASQNTVNSKKLANPPLPTPTPKRLAKAIVDSIKNVLEDNTIDSKRVEIMIREYEKIKNHAISNATKIKKKKEAIEEDNYVLRDLTERLKKSILPLVDMGEKGYDILGRFYREFIRYAGTDKKIGLVLTPHHITEFFCDIVELSVNDRVYDSCCGTGGFLIASMKRMFDLAGNNEETKDNIKDNQLIGVEIRPDMFTFACSNMMMSGDGRSHIYAGDSFSADNVDLVKKLQPSVAFLNPPYDVGEDGQMKFIENALSCLQKGGRCAAIVQMSCATSTGEQLVAVRERIMEKHTLKGVFSMPDDLFYPVGVVTCIMIFDAHKPHQKDFKTFFGYFKDDGFRKTKHMGRVSKNDWNSIKKQWTNKYINREAEAGLSVLHSVTAKDEWCAEAYMKTDYSSITQADFEDTVRNYAIYKLSIET